MPVASRQFKIKAKTFSQQPQTGQRFNVKVNVKAVDNWTISARTDRLAVWATIIWGVFLIIPVIAFIYFQNQLPVQVPLYYSRPWGETQLVRRDWLLFLPAGTLLLGIFNINFAIALHESQRFLSRILFGVTAIVAILTALSVVNIINVVH